MIASHVWMALAVIASAGSVFFLARWVLSHKQLLGMERRLSPLDDGFQRKNKILLLKLLGPFRNILLDQVQLTLSPERRRKTYQLLVRAGMVDTLSVDELVLEKIALMIFLPLMIALLSWLSGGELSLFWVLALAGGGFFFPDFLVRSQAQRRSRQIRRTLPYAIDLLTLSVEAGLDFIAAISRMIKKTKPNALMDELAVMEREIKLGTTRSDALRNFAARCGLEEVNSFVNVLIQADQLGVSIGNVLRAQAEEMRVMRFTRAEAEGAKASQKLLIPMVFCIFPSVFVIIIGPLIIKWITQGFM